MEGDGLAVGVKKDAGVKVCGGSDIGHTGVVQLDHSDASPKTSVGNPIHGRQGFQINQWLTVAQKSRLVSSSRTHRER